MEERRGESAEVGRFEGFVLVSTSWRQCHEALKGTQCSVMVKSSGPRTDSLGSYSGNTA